MPDITGTKISALDADSTITDSDYLAGVDAGASPIKSKKFTFATIKSWIKGWIAKGDVGLGNVANVLQYSANNKPTSADVTYDGTVSGLSATDVKGALDELASEKQEQITTGTITLSLSWSGSGPYTQTVTVSGATISSNSKVDLQLTPAQIAQLIADGVEALVIENNAGTLTATAIGATPSTALTVQCTVTEVVA